MKQPEVPATDMAGTSQQFSRMVGVADDRATAAQIVSDYKHRYQVLWENVRTYEKWGWKYFDEGGAKKYYDAIIAAVAYLESITDPLVIIEESRWTAWIRDLVRDRIGEPSGTFNTFLDGILWR